MSRSLLSAGLEVFPNIHTLLNIEYHLPITSCKAKRSFSGRTKTYLRAIMGKERLEGLALMNILAFDIQIYIDLFDC
jgi:hypothetical protein